MNTYIPLRAPRQILYVWGTLLLLYMLTSFSAHAQNIDMHILQSPDTTQMNQRIRSLEPLTQTLIRTTSTTREAQPEESIQSSVRARKEGMLTLAQLDPAQFLHMAMTTGARKKFSTKIQIDIEEQGNFEGILKVIHFDDFNDPKNSKFKYFLQSGDKEYEFLSPSTIPPLESGATVKVTGYRLADVVVAPVAVDTFEVTRRAPPPESVGNQKTLILLMTYQNNVSRPRPFTKDEAQQIIFRGGMQKFYKEQSYRNTSFSGDVFGWFTVPKDSDQNTCGAGIFEDAKNIIADPANNIDLTKYKRLVMVSPECGGGWSTVGMSSMPIGDKNFRISFAMVGASGYNGTSPGQLVSYFDYVLSHELGHSLGVLHANALECGTGIIFNHPSCYHVEYGNGYDAMGYGSNSLHFNALYKEQLGWLDRRKDVLDIKKSGRYSLRNLETAGGTPKLAKIYPLGSPDPFLALEHRTAFGFDSELGEAALKSNQKGIFISQIIKSYISFPRLLDMTPTTNDSWDDLKNTTLNIGSTFSDPETGITIKTTAHRGVTERVSEMLFDVDLQSPQCFRKTPLLATRIYPTDPAPNESVGVFFTLHNVDSTACDASPFTITMGALPRIVPTQPSAPLVLGPDETGSLYGSIFFEGNLLPGSYTIPITVENATTGEAFPPFNFVVTIS